jgi:hypothetical protein
MAEVRVDDGKRFKGGEVGRAGCLGPLSQIARRLRTGVRKAMSYVLLESLQPHHSSVFNPSSHLYRNVVNIVFQTMQD